MRKTGKRKGNTDRLVALEAGGDLEGTEDDGLMQIARLDAWETRRVEEGPCDFEHLQRASKKGGSESEFETRGRRGKTHSNELREFIRGHEMDKRSDMVKLFLKGFLKDGKKSQRMDWKRKKKR